MKKNMARTMDRLNIDDGIRGLIRQLWKHNYLTSKSCQGHGGKAYVMFTGGDGWFETADKNSHFENMAKAYGLEKSNGGSCCQVKSESYRCCYDCGAGLNGNIIYRGILNDPFKESL